METTEAMETKTQAQLEELLGTIVEFMKQKHMTEYLPVIMISADDEEKNIEYAFDLGAIDFISRPFIFPL